jgi:hypothetical protein
MPQGADDFCGAINFLQGTGALPLRKMNVYSDICSKSEATAK